MSDKYKGSQTEIEQRTQEKPRAGLTQNNTRQHKKQTLEQQNTNLQNANGGNYNQNLRNSDLDNQNYSQSNNYLNQNQYNYNPQPSYVDRMKSKSRECTFLILVGETSVGKSHSVIQMAKGYVRDNPATGKKGRPFFILDVNGEPEYARAFPKVIRFYEVGKEWLPDVYRILPIKQDGSVMDDDEEIRSAMIYIAQHAKRCGICFDDLDAYFEGAKPRALSRLFMGFRHRGGRDVVFTHQRLSAIYPQERAGAKIISLRHTNESVESIKERWRNPTLMALAENIVEEQYELAEMMYMRGKISEEEHKRRRAFFVEIDVRLNKIIGKYSKECFMRNCKKYINLNQNIINKFQKIHCDKDGKPIHDRQQAIDQIINTVLWRYFAGRE